ncbi:hypothetical protein [Streptomyces sp. N35]|uniref:hypothetical protein n=1 Tax=Streptomyces sp. N35 TaxID=2795730 RepID=UPI0018F5FEEB|nr:hypothetical protein [Streptomyces sp. N35]
MMRGVHSPLLAVLATLLAVGACSGGSEPQDKRSKGEEACATVLGDKAMNWLQTRVAEPEFSDPTSISNARDWFRGQVKDYRPGDLPNYVTSQMCEVKDGSEGALGGTQVELRYGVSSYPFDYEFTKQRDVGDRTTAIDAGPDVKLVYWPDGTSRNRFEYHVYVKCGVPNSHETSLNEVPLEGTLKDNLTGDPSHRTHLTHLLHSAKVMTDGFGCTNNPRIPTTVPTSVKD